MQEFTKPEILRTPLAEICLNAKMASDLSIGDFLKKAMDTIPVKNIHESIKLLKTINALDKNENITNLGMHLANLPVDCQFGKMILYSIIFQCVDPILKIICALSVKNIFWFSDKIDIDQIQLSFSEYSLSDHKMVWKIFEAYLSKEEKEQFCKKNGLSKTSFSMMKNLEKTIMRHLITRKYINEFNETKINNNALKWEVVKSIIVAGLYPNICEIANNQIYGSDGISLGPHSSSVLVERVDDRFYTNDKIFNCGANFIVYSHRSHIRSMNFIHNNTLVPSIHLALFVPQAITSSQGDDEEIKLQFNEWIKCSIDKHNALLVLGLRSRLQGIFARFLTEHTSFVYTDEEQEVVDVAVHLIQNEDDIEKNLQALRAKELKENQ